MSGENKTVEMETETSYDWKCKMRVSDCKTNWEAEAVEALDCLLDHKNDDGTIVREALEAYEEIYREGTKRGVRFPRAYTKELCKDFSTRS